MGSTTLDFRYDASGTPMTVTYGGTTYYYATNLQGDVVAIVDGSGTAVVSYTYDAWGNVLTTTGSLASTLGTHNPLRYRGYVYDTETGLYYVSSRYYDPSLNRFINADVLISTGQGMLGNNMFAYCRNNPVSRRDISGMADVDTNMSDDPIDDLMDQNEQGGGAGGNAQIVDTSSSGLSSNSTALQPYYPPNNGFLGTPEQTTLSVGDQIQRTGSLGGRYVAPSGTPTETLSLPYNQTGQGTTYFEVTHPISALAGPAAPWFGQIGGGMQYLLLDGTVEFLMTKGYLKIICGGIK